MKLKDLLKGLEIVESNIDENIEIEGISYNSKNVKKNFIYVCIKGFKVDGHTFIDEAIKNGAVLVVVEDYTDNLNCYYVKTNNTRKALAILSCNFFKNPSYDFNLIGVTGTNGKTSTTYMIKSILEEKGQKVGLIGTIKNIIGEKEFKTDNTTPESTDLQQLFWQMKNEGVDSVVMEVSSHSLDLYRVYGSKYDVAVFTNLTQDHLDFHGTMENYFNAKLKLFNMAKYACINIDDPWGQRLKDMLSKEKEIITYAINNQADVCAKDVNIEVDKSIFTLVYKGQKQVVKLNIPGIFAVYNALSAASACIAKGMDLKTIAQGLIKIKSIAGRFEVVESNSKFTIVVDYAHTPDGLENLLKTVNSVAKGRKVLLFGCGGDRDRTKRPIMGEIAGKMADFVIVTSDNPRTENPLKIIDDILEGIKKTNTQFVVIPDRYEAIKYAISNAKENDFIVLAGKGHEDYQIIGTKKIHFDEREVVKQILEA